MAHHTHWAPFRCVVLVALVAAGLFGLQFKAAADDYPNRVAELIVPFPPGGGVDTEGRVIAQKLSDALGKQVIVVNKPGAGSVIGVRDAAKAAPDGYTLLMLVTEQACRPTPAMTSRRTSRPSGSSRPSRS